MKVFVTGASGFVGSAVVDELLANGHHVLGLARSDESANKIAAAGAAVVRGSLDDLDCLRRGAEEADGVIHCAFVHNFANFGASAEADKNAIEVLGDVLAGSNRPLVISGVLAGFASDHQLTEEDAVNPPPIAAARVSEKVGLAQAAKGVRVSIMRLPVVYGEGDHGFVAVLINIARQKGISAYPGQGINIWSAVHRQDAAWLYRLALESAPAGTRLHPLNDECVPVREIAAVIGRHLDVPVVSIPTEKAAEHFGYLGAFLTMDMAASSELTRERFNWKPTQPGLITDLEAGHYFAPRATT